MIKSSIKFFIPLLLLLFSCSHNRVLTSATKNISGHWLLKTVISEGITGPVSLQLFNEADFGCFIGSHWQFNKDHSGNYMISAATGTIPCSALNREIKWDLFASKENKMLFQFKRLDNDGREIDPNSAGGLFVVSELTHTNIKLRADITYDGKPAVLIYNFVKM